MVTNACDGVVCAEKSAIVAGQLLELTSEYLSGELPDLSLQEAYWLVNALNGGSLHGVSLENLPHVVGGEVGQEAMEHPDNAAIREAMADFPDEETLARFNAMPEHQFGDRIRKLSPVQVLALVTVGHIWLCAGDRSDIPGSLAKAFQIRAA